MTDATPNHFTADDLLKLPRGMGERHELIEGELHTMAPAGQEHGSIAGSIVGNLWMWNLRQKMGKVLSSETGFYTRGDKRTVRAPDAAFVPTDRIPAEGLSKGYDSIVPSVVFEVVSPNDSAAEIEDKTQEWLHFGVDAVCNVFPKTKTVHVAYQDGRYTRLSGDDVLAFGDILPDFQLPLPDLFG